MHIIILAFICALGYLVICAKALGAQRVVKHQLILDLLFTIGIPFLFIGTFSGMATAFLAGLFFSFGTAFLGIITPKPKKPLSDKKTITL